MKDSETARKTQKVLSEFTVRLAALFPNLCIVPQFSLQLTIFFAMPEKQIPKVRFQFLQLTFYSTAVILLKPLLKNSIWI